MKIRDVREEARHRKMARYVDKLGLIGHKKIAIPAGMAILKFRLSDLTACYG